MFTVKIEYKSGKVETTKIKMSDYSAALVQLGKEGRVSKIEIVIVE